MDTPQPAVVTINGYASGDFADRQEALAQALREQEAEVPRIKSAETELAMFTAQMVELAPYKDQDAKALIATAMPTIQHPVLLERLAYALDEVKLRTRDALANADSMVSNRIDRYNRITRRITELRKLIETAVRPTNFVGTVEDLRDVLRTVPHVRAKTVAINTRDRSRPIISWETKSIWMTPDKNFSPWINSGGKVKIKLAPVRITVDMSRGVVKMYATDGGVSSYHHTNSPHPHIMGDDSPCWGDFAQPIIDACTHADVKTIALLCAAYLSQAYTADSAGASWTRWVARSPVIGNLQAFETALTRRHIYDYAVAYMLPHFDVKNGVVTKLNQFTRVLRARRKSDHSWDTLTVEQMLDLIALSRKNALEQAAPGIFDLTAENIQTADIMVSSSASPRGYGG